MKVSKFTTPQEVVKERLSTCKACKFYEDGWCGTPVVGKTVNYYRKKVRLCGCNMLLKTKLPFSSCPAGKWSAVGKLPEFVDDIRALVDRLTPKPPHQTVTWNMQDRRDLHELQKRITAANWGDEEAAKVQFPRCCFGDQIEEMRYLLKRYDKC